MLVAQILKSPPADERLVYSLVLLLRRTLSRELNPLVDFAVALGFIPILHALLDSPSTRIRLEGMWCLTNIAAGKNEYVNMLRALGTGKKVVGLMLGAGAELKEQVGVRFHWVVHLALEQHRGGFDRSAR